MLHTTTSKSHTCLDILDILLNIICQVCFDNKQIIILRIHPCEVFMATRQNGTKCKEMNKFIHTARNIVAPH